MELYLIRHPRPAIAPGICYGQHDVGLAEPLEPVAAHVRALLPAAYALHTSPLARARLLAEALGQPHVDERLMEIHFGEWEGRAFDEIGSAIDDWAADPFGFRAPGGESPRAMATRVLAWLAELQQSTTDLPVVVIAHGGPLRTIAGHLLGLPETRWLGLDFACGKVSRIDVHNWGTVLKWFNH